MRHSPQVERRFVNPSVVGWADKLPNTPAKPAKTSAKKHKIPIYSLAAAYNILQIAQKHLHVYRQNNKFTSYKANQPLL
jgi:hypothetical protein